MLFLAAAVAGWGRSPRDEHAVMNYFDGAVSVDSAAVNRFFDLLATLDHDDAVRAVENAVRALAGHGDGLRMFLDGGERMFYNPPCYDEDLFLAMVIPALESGSLDADYIELLEYYRDQMLMNRRGTVAADFEVILSDGSLSTLHRQLKADGLIVIFYDPECDVCHEVMDRMMSAEVRNVVAVAFLAEDDGWKRDAERYPAGWTFCRPTNDVEEIYSIPHVPTLYHLDGAGRVVCKKTDFGIVAKKQ